MQRKKWVKEGDFSPISNYVYIMKKVIYRHTDKFKKGHLQINGFQYNQTSITYYSPSEELFDICMNQREGFTNFSLDKDRKDKWCIGIQRTSNENKLSEFIEIIDHFDSLEEIKNEIYHYLGISSKIQNHEKAKMKKRVILKNGPLMLLKKNEKPDCVNAFLSQTYSDIIDKNTLNEVKTFLTNRIMECSNYQTSPLLAPLLYLIALSNRCGSNVIKNTPKYKFNQSLKLLHELSIEDKKLKTILSIDPAFVEAIAEEEDLQGTYTYKHSLFATVKNENALFKEFNPEIVEIVKSIDPTLISVLISIIFHEAAHYAALEVMGNPDDAKPFEKNDLKTKNEYLTIFKNIKQVYQTWVAENKQETIAILSISMAFDKSYRKTKQPNELFVKIAEIIGFLGYQNGLTVLNKFVPTLVEFYEKKFNTACIKYLVKNNLESLITVDPHFSRELKRYKITLSPKNVIESSVVSFTSPLSFFDPSKNLQNEYSKFSKRKIEKSFSFEKPDEQQKKIGWR